MCIVVTLVVEKHKTDQSKGQCELQKPTCNSIQLKDGWFKTLLCTFCLWGQLLSKLLQGFLLGIPIKIAIIEKIKSALGTMGRGKSFVTFSTTTKTISSELSLICSWTFDFNSSYRGQIPVKEMGPKYYLVCYSPNVGFDRLLALRPCQLMNSTKIYIF